MRVASKFISIGALAFAQALTAAQGSGKLEDQGRQLFEQADFKQATEVLQKAAADNPNSAAVQLWLGRAWGRRAELASPLTAFGYAKKARLAFESAVRLDPHNEDALNDLFDFYLQAPPMAGGGSDKARALIPSIAAINPSQALFAQARIDEELRHYNSAEARLGRAIELAPQQLGRVLDLAKLLSKTGRYDESELSFQKAEKIAPNAPRILFARAESYIEAGRKNKEARELLHRYLASNLTRDDPPRAEAEKLLRKAEGA